jgi:hypothetical protein
LATAHCSAGSKRDGSDIAGLRQRLDEITQLRRCLSRRLQDSAFEVGRGAVAALLKSQRQIVQCVEVACRSPTAARNAVRALSIGSAERQGRPLPLEDALHAWHGRLEAELNERVSAVAADTRSLLQRVHCELADSRADHRHRLSGELDQVAIDARLPRLEYRSAGVDARSMDGLLAAEVAAAAVLGVTALSPGMIAAFIVSAVLSAALALHRTNRSLERSRRMMRLAVHDVTERAVPEIRAAVQAAIGEYGERLIGALRKTEAELEAACDRARVSQLSTPVDVSDRMQLLEYRCRL